MSAFIMGKVACTLGHPITIQMCSLDWSIVIYEFTTDASGNYAKIVSAPAQYRLRRKVDGVHCASPDPMTVTAGGGTFNINAKIQREKKTVNPEQHPHPDRKMKHFEITELAKLGPGWTPAKNYNPKKCSWVFELTVSGEGYLDVQSGKPTAVCSGDLAVFEESGGVPDDPWDKAAATAPKKAAPKKAAPKKK